MAKKLQILVLCLSSIFWLVMSAASASNRTFLHLSDIHVDFEYTENGAIDNHCHKPTAEGSNVSRYGSYHCDPPKILVESAFEAMKKFVKNPDFILWTGDNSPHVDTLKTKDVMKHLSYVTKKLYQLYPGIPVIPVLGNHDSAPKDFFPYPDGENYTSDYYNNYLTDGSFGDFLPVGSDASEEFKKCGYYVKRNKTLYANITQTFIVLNTALYYHNAALPPPYPDDPCGQLDWLEKTLNECKPKNENVFIMAHVPPGYFAGKNVSFPMFLDDKYTSKFLEIVTKKENADKIVAHFYGHFHTDSFRLFMDHDEVPVGVAFIAPSITPLIWGTPGVNPSFRSYNYDPDNRVIKTYEQYYLPLDQLLPGDDEFEEDQDTSGVQKTHPIGAGLGAPEYLSLFNAKDLNITDCLDDEKASPTATYTIWCLPINRPNTCPQDTWKELDENTELKDCVETDSKNIGAGAGTPKYLSLFNANDLNKTDCLVEEKASLTATYTIWCLPINRPNTCPQDTWKELDENTELKNCKETDSKNNTSIPEDNDDKDPDRRNRNSKYLGKRNKRQSETRIDVDETTTSTTTEVAVTNSSETPHSSIVEEKSDDDQLELNKETQMNLMKDDVAKMLEFWTWGYDAATDYNIKDMSYRSMYSTVFINIRDHRADKGDFEQFLKHTFVLHEIDDLAQCDDACHANITCSLNRFTKADFTECLVEKGFLPNNSIPIPMSTTTPTTTTTFTTTMTTTITTTTTTSSTTRQTPSTTHASNKPEIVGIGITEDNDSKTENSSRVGPGIAIGCVLIAMLAMTIGGIYMYKRIQRRRYCSQEFLLDSFRYDGYSEINQH